MKFLTTLLTALVFLSACKKDTPSVPTEMKIISVEATKWQGDSICGTKAKHYGDYLADNEIRVKGVGFGDNVEVSDDSKYLDVEVTESSDDEIVISTKALAQVDSKAKITIRNDDGKSASFELKFIYDIYGHAKDSPFFYLFDSYYKILSIELPPEFDDNLDPCELDYEPLKGDIVKVNGELKIITSTPSVTANAYYKSFKFNTSKQQCDGETISEAAEFYVNLESGIRTSNATPTHYFRQ